MSTTAPKKRSHHRQVVLVPDAGSACFSDLRYSSRDGGVYATFARDGSQYFYPMSKADAKDWFQNDLGEYFNANVR